MEVVGNEEGVTVVGLEVGLELGLIDGEELGVIVSVGLMLGTIEVVGTTEEDGLVVGDAEVGERLTVGDNVGFDVVGLAVFGFFVIVGFFEVGFFEVGFNVGFAVVGFAVVGFFVVGFLVEGLVVG